MPNKSICKFRCDSVTDFTHGPEEIYQKVVLNTSYDPSLPEDQRFDKATPSGSLEFRITNPQLEGFFVPGRQYLIEISPCS